MSRLQRSIMAKGVGVTMIWLTLLHLVAGVSMHQMFLSGRSNVPLLARVPSAPARSLSAVENPSPKSTSLTDDRHKPWAWTWRNVLGIALACTVGSLGNSVGVGGGAFFVPLGEVLLGFSLKGATALSQAIITGGAVASVGLAVATRHPVDPGKPLIDYGTALMLTPVLLLGVSVGVLLNTLFPDWLLTFLLTALLLWLTLRIVLKARRLFKGENAARASAAAETGTELQAHQLRQAASGASGGSSGAYEDISGRSMRSDLGRTGSGKAQSGSRGPRRRTSARGDTPSQVSSPTGPSRLFAEPTTRDASFMRDTVNAPAMPGIEQCVYAYGWHTEGNKAALRHDSEGLKTQAHRHFYPQTASGDMALETLPAFGLSGQTGGRGSPGPRQREGAVVISPFASKEPNANGRLADRQKDTLQGGQQIDARAGSGTVAVPVSEDSRSASPADDVTSQAHGGTTADGSPRPDGESSSSRTQPWLQMTEVLALWGCFLGLQLGKGRFPRCSALYFVLFGCQALLSVAANILFTSQARRAAAKAQRGASQPILTAPNGIAFHEPTTWGLGTLIRCSLVTLAGGSVAGLLGIGGGMVVAPLLLELGLHPLVAAATSSLMVLFSSSTAALAFGFEGLLNITYALIFGIGCFVASLLGVWIVGRIIRRSGRPSYVVIILAAIIGLGAVLTGVFSGRKAIKALASGQHLGFHGFCTDS